MSYQIMSDSILKLFIPVETMETSLRLCHASYMGHQLRMP